MTPRKEVVIHSLTPGFIRSLKGKRGSWKVGGTRQREHLRKKKILFANHWGRDGRLGAACDKGGLSALKREKGGGEGRVCLTSVSESGKVGEGQKGGREKEGSHGCGRGEKNFWVLEKKMGWSNARSKLILT